MKESEAIRLAGMLAVTGHGWTDAHVEVYAAEFAAEMPDPVAGEAAVRAMIRTWDKPVRIPIGAIMAQYRVEVDKRAVSAPRAISVGRVLSFDEGIEVARRAYIAEARRTGNRASEMAFARFSENLRSSARHDDTSRIE
jgi:hypothetical protein